PRIHPAPCTSTTNSFTPPQLNQEAAASLSRDIAGGTNLGAIEGDYATSPVPSHSQICPHYRSNIDLRAHDTSSCQCYCHHPSTAQPRCLPHVSLLRPILPHRIELLQ
ncbi:hypothetical protein ACJX0J_030887, partial [Zea mays]